jgi:hypothetical protein
MDLPQLLQILSHVHALRPRYSAGSARAGDRTSTALVPARQTKVLVG